MKKTNHFAIRHITREEMTFLENEKQYASTRNIMHASVIVLLCTTYSLFFVRNVRYEDNAD